MPRSNALRAPVGAVLLWLLLYAAACHHAHDAPRVELPVVVEASVVARTGSSTECRESDAERKFGCWLHWDGDSAARAWG